VALLIANGANLEISDDDGDNALRKLILAILAPRSPDALVAKNMFL